MGENKVLRGYKQQFYKKKRIDTLRLYDALTKRVKTDKNIGKLPEGVFKEIVKYL